MRVLYAIEKSTLDDIANAIRAKKGSTEPIPVTNLAQEIESISTDSKGELLEAGTYNMIKFAEDNNTWESQALIGKVTWSSDGIYDSDFTKVSFDDTYLTFKRNEIIALTIYPYWNENDITKVVLEDAQFVDAAFKVWFLEHFVAS